MKKYLIKLLSISLLLITSNISAQEWQMPPATVEVALVESINLALTTDVPANVISKNYAWLSAETNGKVRSIAKIGTKVKKGDVVSVIQTTTLRAQREEQKNNVLSAGARISYLRNQVKRLNELRTQNVASLSQIEDIQSQLDLAISNKAVAEARLSQVRIGIAASSIRAQFDGVVTEQGIQVGELATPGKEVIRVVDLKNREIIIRTPLSTVRYAKIGDKFTLRDNLQDGLATIAALVPFGELTDGVYEIRLIIEKGNWKVGESITAEIPQSKSESVMTVPRDAILLRSGGNSIIKINADKSFTRIAVSTGLGNKNNIEVSSLDGELLIGDKVIIRGGERLQDGQDIVIKE